MYKNLLLSLTIGLLGINYANASEQEAHEAASGHLYGASTALTSAQATTTSKAAVEEGKRNLTSRTSQKVHPIIYEKMTAALKSGASYTYWAAGRVNGWVVQPLLEKTKGFWAPCLKRTQPFWGPILVAAEPWAKNLSDTLTKINADLAKEAKVD